MAGVARRDVGPTLGVFSHHQEKPAPAMHMSHVGDLQVRCTTNSVPGSDGVLEMSRRVFHLVAVRKPHNFTRIVHRIYS